MISVIMANYNGEAYLSEAIESVLAQQGAKFEFIIVDDGSTDRSRTVIDHYQQRNGDRIIVIQHVINQGQGEGFNTGFRVARGELIAFIDSDDIWFPDKLARVARLFEEKANIAFLQHNLSIQRGEDLTEERFRDILTLGDYFSYTRRKGVLPQFTPTSGLVFRRAVLEKVMPIPSAFRTCADGFLTRTTFCYGEVAAINECWGAYRVHGANNTFDNPGFSNHRYLSRLLIPELNRFYKNKGIDFSFHDRMAQLHETIHSLELQPGSRVLVIRCATITVVQDLLEVLFEQYSDVSVDLLVQSSVEKQFTDSRVNPVLMGEGPISEDTVSAETLAELHGRKYDLGLIPYSVNNFAAYLNVHQMARRLNHCRFFGINYDGFAVAAA